MIQQQRPQAKQGFSSLDKARSAERELAMRQAVYPGLVNAGKLTADVAQREIALMDEIAKDYRAKARAEAEAIQPRMFKED